MTDSPDLPNDVTELQEMVRTLQSELAQTSQERVQAAEYGLSILEERNNLQTSYEELESVYENTKHELECAQEVTKESFINFS